MTPQLHHDLERDARRFDTLGGRELGLEEVLGRARGIRRRRRATTLAAAAAVVAAIAVPGALLTRTHEHTAPDPARRLPTIERIGLATLPVGARPATGWLQDRTWHASGGDTVRVPAGARAVAALGDGVVAALTDDTGESTAVVVRGDGGLDRLGPMSGGLATSPKGGVVAFVGPRSVTAVQDGTETTETSLGGLDRGPDTSYDAVAVSGEDCRNGHPCAVFVNDVGAHPHVTAAVTATADLAAIPRIRTLTGVSTDGLLAGITKVTDDGTCSEVQRGGTALWRTCDARLLAFTPDGRHLLGSSAYADGLGDTALKTFDARTGRPGLDLSTEDGATITQMRWEDDEHLLAVVQQDQRWGVLRIGLDRTVEYAVAPVAGSSDDPSPFLLPD